MIVTYPLDNYQFDAADAAGYFSTRQSGVYSAEEDFAVTASGGTSVTVAPGRAWIHPDRWTGYSVLCRDPQTVELPTADGTRTRLDRIVLRYDAAARKTRLLVLPGEPDSASPTAPEITRTGLVYDLGLALVTRKAGSTAITSADLADTRADEAVCGVMRDGVTGIPTAQLVEQAKAKVAGLEETATASAQAAEQSAAGAAKSQTDAASSASTAATQAQAAAKSAQAASSSQSAAAGSASTATNKAQEAASSAAAAAQAETAAAGSASAAATSAQAAAKSASEAKAAAGTDKTLTMDGAPADAKATGDALAQRYTKDQADAKFGTPYTLPVATADQLGGVKVGDYLDIAPDGTLSGKTLNDKIAAAVAVKSAPRLVWNSHVETGTKWKTYDIKMPDGLDYVHVKSRYNDSSHSYGKEVDIAKGGTVNHDFGKGTSFPSNTTFRTDGTLHFELAGGIGTTGGYTVDIWLSGYHYPTIADLLTETQAAQADAEAVAVDQEYRLTLLEAGVDPTIT